MNMSGLLIGEVAKRTGSTRTQRPNTHRDCRPAASKAAEIQMKKTVFALAMLMSLLPAHQAAGQT
jgi:hypothetical protein